MKKGYVYKRGNTWSIAIPDNLCASGYKRLSGFPTKSKAIEYLDKRKEHIRDLHMGNSGAGNILYREFFKEYLSHIQHNYSHQTHKTYKGVLKDFVIFMERTYPQAQWLHELSPRVFDRYKLWLRDCGYKDQFIRQKHKSTTINNHLKVLKAMFNQARKWKYVSDNPINDVENVNVDDEKLIITLDTPGRFNLFFERCKTMRPEYYPHYYCATKLGLRFGEMATLEWSNVDFEYNQVKITRTESFTPKGRSRKDRKPKERIIPMSSDVVEILKRLPKHNKRVFLYKNKPIKNTEKSFRNWIITIVRGTELEGMTRFHELRHTTGHILGQKHQAHEIKEFLGHADIKTTLRYIRVADEAKRRMAGTLGNFGNTTQNTTQK